MYLTCRIFISTTVRISHNLLMFFIILLQFWSFPASLSTIPAVSSPPRNYFLPSPSPPHVPNSFSPRILCFIRISNCFLLWPFLFLIQGFYIAPFSLFHSISSSLPLPADSFPLILFTSESVFRYHLPPPRYNPTIHPCFSSTTHHPSFPLPHFLLFLPSFLNMQILLV